VLAIGKNIISFEHVSADLMILFLILQNLEMKSQIVVFCLLFSLTAALSEITIPEGVSVSATRNVDITSQLVKVSTDYEVLFSYLSKYFL
jgi:hypothetical protein